MVGERRVGVGHRQRRHLHGAQRERRHAQERISVRQLHAHGLGDLSLSTKAVPLRQCDEVRVGGEGRRLEHVQVAGGSGVVHRDRLELLPRGAVDELLERLGARRVDALERRESGLQCRRESEDLERRPGLHADRAAVLLVDVVVVRRLATAAEPPLAVLHHRDHVAGARLHHRDGRSALAGVLDGDVLRHGVERRTLHVGVERGPDGEPAAPEEGLALHLGLSVRWIILDHANDVVAEVRRVGRRAAVGLEERIQGGLDVDVLGSLRLGRGDVPRLHHLVEHEIAALLGQVGVAGGIERRRLLDDPGQGGALRQVEFARGLGEVASGGCLDPVGPGAEVHDVEVLLEDLVLGEAPLQGERVADLAQLPRGGARPRRFQLLIGRGARDEDVLDVLLRDGGSALPAAFARGVRHDGPHGAAQVDAGVVEEARVLDGHDRLAHHGRDRAQGDLDAVLVVDRREDRAVCREDDRSLREFGGVELVREAFEALHCPAGDEPGTGRQGQDHGGDDSPGGDRNDEEAHQAQQGPEGSPGARGAFPHECSFPDVARGLPQGRRGSGGIAGHGGPRPGTPATEVVINN